MTTTPPALADGDRVRIVAPSGPIPMQRFDRGLKVLRRQLDVETVMGANLLEQDGFLAGSDGVRLAALHEALGDPEAKAILCARGGYGTTRLLPALDPERLRERPKTLVGFSDITALLCWAYVRADLRSIHGPVVTQLATLCPEDLERFSDLLRGEVPMPLCAEEGTVISGGMVEGPLIIGNLEVLRSLVGTRYMPPMAGAILAVEDVGEAPYRIDRALTQLLTSGALRGVRGVAVGQLVSCDPAEGIGPSAQQVVVERLETLGVPVVTGLPFGHDPSHNAALPFGARVRLDADNCTLICLEPATATA